MIESGQGMKIALKGRFTIFANYHTCVLIIAAFGLYMIVLTDLMAATGIINLVTNSTIFLNMVRVRFAPSPTGPLHIGGVRTALYNYLFARKHGGKMILRIEDTDQTRFVPGAEAYIMESLKWCGIEIDEGIEQGGPFGPYRQSDRKSLYRQYADELLSNGMAYIAFDSAEKLDSMRKQFEADKKTFTYNAEIRQQLDNSLALPKETVEQRIAAGEPYVIRFKMPANEWVCFTDSVRETVKVNTATLDDKVLYKSDGMPTYHLANIVDDHLMEITHVIRGEEWLPSAPLHILLYKAFGWEAPQFAHLPLLLKPEGNGKLSKRDGDRLGFPVFPLQWKHPQTGETSSGYRESGYFHDAFINLLAMLGWNPGTDQELFSMDELIAAFSLEKVGKSGSRFDLEKAKWFNHQYLIQRTDEEIAGQFRTILQSKDIHIETEKLIQIIGFVKERVNFVSELWDQTYFFFEAPTSYDAKTVKKRWKESTPEYMQQLIKVLEPLDDFSSAHTEALVKAWIEKNELGMGAIMNAFRLCIVGAGKGPHMFDIIEVIGKQECLSRLQNGIANIKK